MPRELYLAWADVENMIRIIAEQAKDTPPEAIVGIATGGLVPAVMLAKYFNVESFQVVRAKHYGDSTRRVLPTVSISRTFLRDLVGDMRRVWVVDDIVDTGATMSCVLDKVRESTSSLATGVPRRVALLWRGNHLGSVRPDFVGQILTDDSWVVFPWEWDGKANPKMNEVA